MSFGWGRTVETEEAAAEGTGQPAKWARQQKRRTIKDEYHVFAELMDIYIRHKFTCR